MTKKLCALCEKEIVGSRNKSYTKYCSNECYIRNTRLNASKKAHLRRKKQTDKACVICNKIFTPVRFTQKTCSSECRLIHTKNLQKKGRNKLTPVPCKICKKEFQPKTSLHKNCSPKCREVDYHNKEIIRSAKRRQNRKDNKISSTMMMLGIVPTDINNVKTKKHSNPEFCNSLEDKHSELKDKVKEFIKNGGKIVELPEEKSWPMFPQHENIRINTKRILDYERDYKSRREEAV